jgi:putative peptidoglycan lipid II flippase
MKIFKSAIVITLFSIFARIAGFVRDSLIAKYAGVGMMADVFFASFKITNFFRKIFAEGTFFAAFVPSFTKILKEKGKIELSIFSSNVFSIMFYFLVIITLIFEVFMEEITALTSPGFLADIGKFNLTVEVSRILFWYFILIVGSSILCGLLNSIKKFTYYAIVPVFLNASLIVFILFFKDNFKTFAHTLAYGVLVGGVFQFGVAYFGCVREGFRIRLYLPSRKVFQPDVTKTFKKMFPAIIAGGLSQINTLIDLILGSCIVSGVSYLYYVDRIFYLPTASIGTAISIVVLPMLSSAIDEKNGKDVTTIQTESINLSSIFVLPVAFALIFCADIFVSITFERGNFLFEHVQIVGNCLKILGVGLPFVVYMKVLSAIFFSNGNTKTPMYVSLLCALLNGATSIILMRYIGIYGIIIGSCLSYMVDAIVTFFLLKRKSLISLNIKDLFFFNTKVVIASLVFGLFCFFFFSYYHHTKYYGNISEHGLWLKFLYLSVISGTGILLYYIVLKIFKIDVKKVILGG